MAELFDRYAVDRVPRWPLLSRLVALSVVLHGLFILAVIYVPTLRGLLYVAGSFAGVKVVDRDYDPTLIGQRATLIRVGGEPYEKLYYPTDYFGPPPVDPALDPALVAAVAPPPPPPVIIRSPRPARVPTPEPSPEATPDASPSPSPTPEVAAQAEGQKKTEEELNRIAQENDTPRPPSENELNLRPLKDVLNDAKTMLASGQLDLKDTIELTVEADRLPDGQLENVVYKDAKGDPDAYLLAQKLVTGLSQSRVLQFLKDTRHLAMFVKLDQQDVFVSITTEAETPERAGQMSLGYGTMIAIAREGKKGTDEGAVFNNMQVSSDGKLVTMKFQMPRETAAAMLSKVKTTE